MSRFQMLSDTQWELIAPMLPTRTGRAGRPFADARTMVGPCPLIVDTVSVRLCRFREGS